MVFQHSIGAAVRVEENLLIFPSVQEPLGLLLGFGSEVIRQDANYLLLIFDELHDIFIDTEFNLMG